MNLVTEAIVTDTISLNIHLRHLFDDGGFQIVYDTDKITNRSASLSGRLPIVIDYVLHNMATRSGQYMSSKSDGYPDLPQPIELVYYCILPL